MKANKDVSSSKAKSRVCNSAGRQDMGKIEEMVKNLSPELQSEVEDFIQFLLNKQKKKPAKS